MTAEVERRGTTLSAHELDDLLDAAAERGAKKALERVGLHDDGDHTSAAKDINDLRDLIDGWRQVKKGVLSTIGKALGVAILAGLAFLTGKGLHLN